MTAVPANLTRVPNLLASQLLLSGITRSNLDLLTLQSQLASNKRVTKFSDDAIAASAISVLLDRLSSGQQVLGNLSSADNALSYLDSSVADATSLVQEAKSLASSQIGATSDPTTRNNQAVVVDGMIRQLFNLANRSTNGLYIFGGSNATSAPIEELRGGFRYTGRGSGLLAALGSASDVPITIGGENAIGEVSARVRSNLDLNPFLTLSTRLSDIAGARGLGVSRGPLSFSFNGGPTATVDLSHADTVQDVANALTSAIQQYQTDNGVTVLGPGGVSVSGGAISIDVVSGSPTNPALVFTDPPSGTTAADLGLSQNPYTNAAPAGADVNPRLTLLTPLSAVPGLTLPPGSIRLSFSSAQGVSNTDVDISSAQTFDDVRNLIETAVPGVRVQVNAAGTGIDLFNEIAGPALSIGPTGVGPDTATQLGIRSLTGQTRTTDFNDGRGIRIVDNAVDPVSGVATRALNTDFRITLGNGQAFDVDLRPQDLTNTQSLIDRINQEFANAVGQPPLNASAPPLAAGDFTAGLALAGNGIALTQNLGGTPAAIRIEQQNNSAAAEDLGLSDGAYDATSATFTAQDRAGVRVNNIFTALIRLRDALRNDDSSGITVAGSELDGQIDRLAQTQALVGVYANRIQRATHRQEDENVLNEKVRSQLQDLDFAAAASRFSSLQTQLQAAYQTGSQLQNLSLLDFLR